MNEDRPKLLYASPFPPQRSGIADYSAILVKALSSRFDITIYIEDYEVSDGIIDASRIIREGVDDLNMDEFDYVIYNMGNDNTYHHYIYKMALQHSGIVILHDLCIYNFIMAYYESDYSKIYERFGIDSFNKLKYAIKDDKLQSSATSSQLPLNDELLRSGNRFIVHSEYSRQRILDTGFVSEADVKHVNHINLIDPSEAEENYLDRDSLLERFEIPKDAFVVISAGYISEAKRNIETARVIERIASTGRKICYVMVGEGYIEDTVLKEGLIIKTGYTTLLEFNSFIKNADLIINLRYPPLGETSGSMLRILQMGKTAITNNGGWFSEIPDDIVVKIDIDNLEDNLEQAVINLMDDKEYCKKIGDRAAEYVNREHSKEVVVDAIYDFVVGQESS